MNKPAEVLKKHWGYASFRPLQEEIITAVLAHKDVLALMPTGGGKSLCFQVPGLCMEGLCLVISPLIALMRDQVSQLKQKGITAEALHSGLSKREIDYLLDNAANSNLKFLYCSPERLLTPLFQERIKKINELRGVCLIAVDEAHCISQWGFDFRPAYREIAALRDILPKTAIIALTATAPPKVQADIQEQLQFKAGECFIKSFARPNLSYSVRIEEHKEARLIQALRKIAGPAVVYAGTRKRVREITLALQKAGISADFYHAGLTHQERVIKQENWMHNRDRVIVATNAFGMGIDKSDVRMVVHMDLPDTLEAYYQEAGRAGRDEKKAYALCVFNQRDIDMLRMKTQQSVPSLKTLQEVYQMLGNYYQLANGSMPEESLDFNLNDFAARFDRHQIEIFHALKILQEQGLIHLSESFYAPSKLIFLLSQKTLYEFQIANSDYDQIIKGILRFHGGEAFRHMVKLEEQNLAALLKCSIKDIRGYLLRLHQMEVVFYQPQKETPQLIFLQAKQAIDRLPIDEKALQKRRKQKKDKMEALIHYLHARHICRTRLLLEYFGEEDYERCGVCDNCLAELRLEKETYHRQHYTQQIVELMSKTEVLSPEELIRILDPSDCDIMLLVLSELVDHGKLHYNEFGQIIAAKS